jgi:hypothetical protein
MVGERVVGYFAPTPATIGTLEDRLRPALEVGRTKPEALYRFSTDPERRAEETWGVRSALTEIVGHFRAYRRQYVGIIVQGGARRVLVNSFPELEITASAWTAHWIDGVDDGGSDYWRIQYDLASGAFLGFDINPSA